MTLEEEHSHSHYHGVDRAEEHVSVTDALKILLGEIRKTKSEEVQLQESDNRVLYKILASPQSLPETGKIYPRWIRDQTIWGHGRCG